MAGLEDLMARSQAAGGMMGGMGAPPEELPGPTPETEPGGEAPDVEAGLSMVEAYAEGIDPATGDQVREHVNAIRELTANAVPGDAPPPDGAEIAAGPELPMGEELPE